MRMGAVLTMSSMPLQLIAVDAAPAVTEPLDWGANAVLSFKGSTAAFLIKPFQLFDPAFMGITRCFRIVIGNPRPVRHLRPALSGNGPALEEVTSCARRLRVNAMPDVRAANAVPCFTWKTASAINAQIRPHQAPSWQLWLRSLL